MAQSNRPTGLTSEEVRQRIAQGQVNRHRARTSKSVPRIIADNLFTFFNLINAVLGALVISTGSYKNALFLGVITINTLIGIAQEIRAKRTLDKLSVLTEAKATALRDGQETAVPMDELVLGDVFVLMKGNQVLADARVLEGQAEVNESLLTGESDAVTKKPGDELLSGSYALSGRALAEVIRVGADSYANRLASEAKKVRKHPSVLRDALNRILKVVSIIIVPLGAGYFFRQYLSGAVPVDEVIVGTVAAVLGMIPEGLILLTTIALAVGVINLGKRRTLVRELFCLETLARTTVICMDKTGTLTAGKMDVVDVEPLGDSPIDQILGNMVRALPDDSETFAALRRKYPPREDMRAEQILMFSSERKYSAATFEGGRTYLIGAYEFLFPAEHRDEALSKQIEAHAKSGARTLVLATGEVADLGRAFEAKLQPLALIMLSDVVRSEVRETLEFFRNQQARMIILSGDHPATVAAIAQRLDFEGADKYTDATVLQSEEQIRASLQECQIYGRVLPAQKKLFVQALKAMGHTVAMVGDGVNDVPALKEADCSIAMASGSSAASQCANLVLLDSDFSALPHIVGEGRRVINNIQSASSLFLVKTIFSVLMTAIMLLVSSQYPFMPIQLTLIGACAVGIPTFLFALKPNLQPIEPNFFRRVMEHALSGALVIVLFICIGQIYCAYMGLPAEVMSTMSMIITGVTSLVLIGRVYPIESPLQKTIYCGMFALFFGAILLFRGLFQLEDMGYVPSMMVLIMSLSANQMLLIMNHWVQSLLGKHLK